MRGRHGADGPLEDEGVCGDCCHLAEEEGSVAECWLEDRSLTWGDGGDEGGQKLRLVRVWRHDRDEEGGFEGRFWSELIFPGVLGASLGCLGQPKRQGCVGGVLELRIFR